MVLFRAGGGVVRRKAGLRARPDEPFQNEGGVEEEKRFINKKSSPCLLQEDEKGQYLVEHQVSWSRSKVGMYGCTQYKWVSAVVVRSGAIAIQVRVITNLEASASVKSYKIMSTPNNDTLKLLSFIILFILRCHSHPTLPVKV